MISGTSHDGIDVAVVDFTLKGGTLHGELLHNSSTPYPPSLRKRLVKALPPASVPMGEVCALDTLIGQAFAGAAKKALEAGPVDLICSHGQTVYHWIEEGQAHGTLQLGQPAWIAEQTGVPVVADLRARDVAAGGQGAPLVALMDTLLLAGLGPSAGALNIGGIANLTVCADPPLAYDTGPGNALIDAAALSASGGRLAYDADGRLAASGRIEDHLLALLLTEPFYQQRPPKTTGKELFNSAYLGAAAAGYPLMNVVSTVTALTAHTIAAQVLEHGLRSLVISGGGCANPVLMRMLAERLPGVTLTTSDSFGAPSDAKEAIAFALLGWMTAHGLPGNLPSCTGARRPAILGTIVPGREPLRLPDQLATAPGQLILTV
jgi:anhydro-N-acetylmuramic acid kinase